MQNEKRYLQIQLEVLEQIIPKKEERERLENEFQAISAEIRAALLEEYIDGQIELAGSFSRNTWISGNRDIDIFIILPRESNASPEEVLAMLKTKIALPWEKRHAKHPYLYAKKDDLEIEIIPCYDFKPGMKILSAVDRSPAHKGFIKKHLQVGGENEVRLLKQFMRGINTYGAEIKVQGFSGYLVELLVIHFGGRFLNVLQNAHTLPGKVITFTRETNGKKEQFERAAFVVIDPTDENRNVASSVSKQKLFEFIAAAKNYLHKPSKKYFFPEESPISTKELAEQLRKSKLHYSAIFYPRPKIVDDVLWGQIHRFERSFKQFLKKEGLEPIKVDSLANKEEIMTVIISQKETIPAYRWNPGPPVGKKNQEAFLEKHRKNPAVVYGPTVIGKKWQVLLLRKKENSKQLFERAIENREIVVPSHLKAPLEKKSEMLLGEKLVIKIAREKERLKFLYRLLKGKPPYL